MLRKATKVITLLAFLGLMGCGCTDAQVASSNLRESAEQFEIYRRVVFYNGITDRYILQMEGYCSITDRSGQLEVIVKMKNGSFMKHHLGLSDNVTYFSEQLRSQDVSSDRYRVIFKPEALIPTLEMDKPDKKRKK